jgi:hypothetical protein
MTLDKHLIEGVGGFSAKVLPASEFGQIMMDAGYSISASAPAKGGRLKFWWVHPNFRQVESIYSGDKTTVITAYHVS